MNTVNTLLESKIKKLNEIVADKAVTHVNMRRPDDLLVDIPVEQALATIQRHPDWEVVDGAYPKVEFSSNSKQELPVLPAKPSEKLEILNGPVPGVPPDNSPASDLGKPEEVTLKVPKKPAVPKKKPK